MKCWSPGKNFNIHAKYSKMHSFERDKKYSRVAKDQNGVLVVARGTRKKAPDEKFHVPL
ncbi:MAG: hypothetical protein OEV66_12085 [Spirochaetia bacterium]|nr:hypothetical protein [Spirochaetia bacterium]